MKFFALWAATAASLAFQMSVDAGYIRDFAWLIPWFWGASAALWTARAITHDKLTKEWLKDIHARIGRGIQPIRLFLCLLVFVGVSLGLRGLIKLKQQTVAAALPSTVQQLPSTPTQQAPPSSSPSAPTKKVAPPKKGGGQSAKAQGNDNTAGNIDQSGGGGGIAVIGNNNNVNSQLAEPVVHIEPEIGAVKIRPDGRGYDMTIVNTSSEDVDHTDVTLDYFWAERSKEKGIEIKSILRVLVCCAGSKELHAGKSMPLNIGRFSPNLYDDLVKTGHPGLPGVRLIAHFRRTRDGKDFRMVRAYAIQKDALAVPLDSFPSGGLGGDLIFSDIMPYMDSTDHWTQMIITFGNKGATEVEKKDIPVSPHPPN